MRHLSTQLRRNPIGVEPGHANHHKSPVSLVVLDELERLLECVRAPLERAVAERRPVVLLREMAAAETTAANAASVVTTRTSIMGSMLGASETEANAATVIQARQRGKKRRGEHLQRERAIKHVQACQRGRSARRER